MCGADNSLQLLVQPELLVLGHLKADQHRGISVLQTEEVQDWVLAGTVLQASNGTSM